MVLPDQASRTAFQTQIDRNFTVSAPAGVGKTTAIVARIAEIARRDVGSDDPLLPRLVVVTYTRAAAEEMRSRARDALVEERESVEAVTLLRQAFFGTIHSFCLNLVKEFGLALGLPSALEIAEDQDRLWLEFLRQYDEPGTVLPDSQREALLRHVPLDKLLELGRKLPLYAIQQQVSALGGCPQPELSELLGFECKNKRSLKTIEAAQQAVRDWQKACEAGDYAPLPILEKGGREFQEICDHTFHNLRNWLGKAAMAFACEVANEYAAFRRQHRQVTFDDLAFLATELLNHPVAGREIRARRYSVLLDEAQDTDPLQFQVLTEIARPERATGCWIDGAEPPPEQGRFSMVGDPQQSIYSDRADLQVYQRLRQQLVEQGVAEELTFTVTMRCQQSVVEAVNTVVPTALGGSGAPGDQVKFVPLHARPDAVPGQVFCHCLNLELEGKPSKDEIAVQHAKAFAQWLKQLTPADLQARSWSEVAILSPINKWTEALAEALSTEELPFQLLSRGLKKEADPAHAWFTALMLVMAEPTNSFELVGVLREIYGLSDHDLAVYREREDGQKLKASDAFQLLRKPERDGPVARVMAQLVDLREEVSAMSLSDAVAEVVRRTRLRERLKSLPAADPATEDAAIDRCLAEAIQAENDQLSLYEFAHQRVDALRERQDEPAAQADAIQLLSCHKAKGLGWDAVILPFFFRKPVKPSENYPRIFKKGSFGRVVAIDKIHKTDNQHERAKEAEQHNLERLLYVAMTRARNSLVLIDDCSAFEDKSGTFADCIGIKSDAVNRRWLEELPRNPFREEQETAAGGLQAAQGSASSNPALIEEVARGLAAATHCARRITPSSLAVEDPVDEFPKRGAEARMTSDFPDEAPLDPAAYGNWWHFAMETAPWSDGREALHAHLEESLEACPDPERGKTEQSLFLQSEIVDKLLSPSSVVRTEVPFLWRRNDDQVVEGLIDCALFDQKEEEWLLIDWKTDRLPDLPESLLEKYQPQVAVYLEAVESIFGSPAEALLYSTASGQIAHITSDHEPEHIRSSTR